MTDQDLARKFHDVYERLAPSFGYATRDDTKQFDPETPNGRLMTAVCGEIRAAIAQATPPAVPDGWRKAIADLRLWMADGDNIYLEIEFCDKLFDAVEDALVRLEDEAPAPIAAESAQEEWREDSYNAVKIWAGAEDLTGDGPNLYGYNIARQHVREILKTLHEDLHEWLRCDNCGMDMRGHDRMGHCFERASTESAAPIAPPEWVKAVQEAYGWLWHVNNEPMAPVPMWSPEQAAYEARKNLRDLLTKEQRGEAINAVSGLVSGLLENKASAATQAESAAPIAPDAISAFDKRHEKSSFSTGALRIAFWDEFLAGFNAAATQASAPSRILTAEEHEVIREAILDGAEIVHPGKIGAPQVDAPPADLRDALLRALVEAAYMQAGDERQIALWRCAKATRAALAQAQQEKQP